MVSVIIAARNEYPHLCRLLPELLKQEHRNYQIIIASDRSDDGTEDLLRQYHKQDPRILPVFIRETPVGWDPKKHALEQAIRQADGEILLLTDADCRPRSNHWISSMTAGLECKDPADVILGHSGYQSQKGLLNLFIRYETTYTFIQYSGYTLAGIPYMAVGRNFAYKKAFYKDVGGFSAVKSCIGGDDDLLLNMFADKTNARIEVAGSPSTQTYTFAPETFPQWFHQKKRHLQAGKRYRATALLISACFFISYPMLYTGLIGSLITGTHENLVISGFILRTGLLMTIFATVSKRLKEKFPLYWVPILDILYFLYLIILGSAGHLSKKTQWATT